MLSTQWKQQSLVSSISVDLANGTRPDSRKASSPRKLQGTALYASQYEPLLHVSQSATRHVSHDTDGTVARNRWLGPSATLSNAASGADGYLDTSALLQRAMAAADTYTHSSAIWESSVPQPDVLLEHAPSSFPPSTSDTCRQDDTRGLPASSTLPSHAPAIHARASTSSTLEATSRTWHQPARPYSSNRSTQQLLPTVTTYGAAAAAASTSAQVPGTTLSAMGAAGPATGIEFQLTMQKLMSAADKAIAAARTALLDCADDQGGAPEQPDAAIPAAAGAKLHQLMALTQGRPSAQHGAARLPGARASRVPAKPGPLPQARVPAATSPAAAPCVVSPAALPAQHMLPVPAQAGDSPSSSVKMAERAAGARSGPAQQVQQVQQEHQEQQTQQEQHAQARCSTPGNEVVHTAPAASAELDLLVGQHR